jgi:hypothetical protein
VSGLLQALDDEARDPLIILHQQHLHGVRPPIS